MENSAIYKLSTTTKNIYLLLHIAHLCFFSQWKEILEKTLADLDKEIADLSEAKELTEDALEAKNIPTDTVVENLTIREGRHGIDIVQDEVENQLHKVCVHSICEWWWWWWWWWWCVWCVCVTDE